MLKILCFLLVNNRPIQSADSIGFWPIVSVSADSQNSTIGRPLKTIHIYLETYSCTFSITDDAASDFSSKSGSPSPILGGPRLPHGVVASRDLVRDFRESSVHSRSSHGDHEESPFREESIPRSDYGEERQSSQRHPSPFNRASNSSLGVSLSGFCI